jgi:hypothetical protein
LERRRVAETEFNKIESKLSELDKFEKELKVTMNEM